MIDKNFQHLTQKNSVYLLKTVTRFFGASVFFIAYFTVFLFLFNKCKFNIKYFTFIYIIYYTHNHLKLDFIMWIKISETCIIAGESVKWWTSILTLKMVLSLFIASKLHFHFCILVAKLLYKKGISLRRYGMHYSIGEFKMKYFKNILFTYLIPHIISLSLTKWVK